MFLPMAQTTDVVNGWNTWLDYDRPAILQWNWTLSTSDAGILTNFVAVVLTLAVPRLFLIMQRWLELRWVKRDNTVLPHQVAPDTAATASNPGGSAQDITEDLRTEHVDNGPQVDPSPSRVATARSAVSSTMNTPSEGSEAIEAHGQCDEDTADPDAHKHSPLLSSATTPNQANSFSKAFMRRETPQGTFLELLTSTFDRSLGWGQIALRIVVALLCIGFFILVTIATVYSVWIASQPISLSASRDCGWWVLDDSIDSISPFNYLQEKEAGNYATRCYNASDGVDGCNFFLAQSIPFEEVDEVACPFADGFCLEDNNAYKLTTSLVSSKELGINVPVGYTFNRTTTCSPIQRKDYVDVDEDYGLINYYYGPLGGLSEGNQTWLSFPNYRTWTGSGYQVETFCSVDADGGWHPIPEFLPADNPEVTLMLVYSQRNFHKKKRLDPIFPATSMLLVGSEILYLNTDLVATVLACTDKTTICDAAGQKCWDAYDDPVAKPETRVELNGLIMLQLALIRSNICHSILYRGGSALDATSKLYVYQSLPLAKEQWKVEARKMFATSLARTQIDLRDYIRGAAAHEPGFVNILNPKARGICNQYKFKSNGWTNITVWGFVCAIAVSLVAFGLTYQIKNPATDGKIKSDRLSIEALFSWGYKVVIWVRGLPKIFPWMAQLGNRGRDSIKNWFSRPAAPGGEADASV